MMLGNQLGVGGKSMVITGVEFDGSTDFLNKSTALTGASDGKLFTFCGWVYSTSGQQDIFMCGISAAAHTLRFERQPSSFLNFLGKSATGGANRLRVESSVLTNDTWHHIALSVDMADSGKRHLIIDGVSDANFITYANNDIGFTETDWGIAAQGNGGNKLDGNLAEIWFDTVYTDFSILANLEKFIKNGSPVALGKNGETPFGTSPLIFFSGNPANWNAGTNFGTGGNFTMNGNVTKSLTNPKV